MPAKAKDPDDGEKVVVRITPEISKDLQFIIAKCEEKAELGLKADKSKIIRGLIKAEADRLRKSRTRPVR